MNKKNKSDRKKALIVSTTAAVIDQFCSNDILLLEKEYDLSIAANFEEGNSTSDERIQEFKEELFNKDISINQISFNRNPYSKDNISAYKNLKALIDNNHFHIIHCHTPIASSLVRLAAQKSRKNGTKVIYTAHGFHFYKGAPKLNWLVYYPIERFLSRFTDVIITINKEDYSRAKKSFKAKQIKYIPGIGIETEKFSDVKVHDGYKNKELGLPEDSFVLLSIGELNKNKNHQVVIKALKEIDNDKIHYLICGQGGLEDYLEDLIRSLDLENNVHLLGFRNDVNKILKVSDTFIFPSLREGLSVSLMEAMASGLPIICSDIRGNSDLIEHNKGGYLVNPKSPEDFVEAIRDIKENKIDIAIFKENNIRNIKEYSKDIILRKIADIYGEII